MDEELELEMPAAMPTEGGAPDLAKIAEMVRAMADQLSQLQSMLPQDAGEDMAALVDEGNADGEMDAATEGPSPVASGDADMDASSSDPKEQAKARAAAMLSRSLK